MSTPNPAPSGPPLRALAMVLIALAILFAGLGALSWSSDSKPEAAAAATSEALTTTMPAAAVPAATTTAATTTTATNTTTAAATTSASVNDVAASVTVRVLNNSTVAGLAAEMASRLRNDGWTVSQTGNYSDENIAQTTVYYGDAPSAKQAATMIADEIGATAAPSSPGLANSTEGVIVILTGR